MSSYESFNLASTLRQVPVPPVNALFVGIDVLLSVRPLNTLYNQFTCDECVCQAANGVSSSYGTLLELFECLGSFLKRLEIYTTILPTQTMMDMIVKILVESLTVLALAMKQLKQGRFSEWAVTYTLPATQCATEKFAKKLLREAEIEAVLQRLDRLTQDEARVTVAQTLGVVYGLVGSVKAVMEGAKWLHDNFQILLPTLFLLDGKASTDSIRQDLSMCLARNKFQPC